MDTLLRTPRRRPPDRSLTLAVRCWDTNSPGLNCLRRRYGELIQEEIAAIVADPADAQDEIRYILTALGRA
jgi:hypothetical protein